MSLFTGSGVAIVTPFDESNRVNYEKLGQLIDWQLENNTDAIIICGTTGEASTLSDAEHKKAIEFAVKQVNKRVPVIAGTGSNDTFYAVELSKSAEVSGADGVLVVPPYYNKTTQKGLIKYFTTVADSINIPVLLYNVPSRTGLNIEIETVVELSKHKNIVGIKEASGNIGYACDIARLTPDDFSLYSGNDDMIVPILSLGGHGVISVLSNVLPQATHDIVNLYHQGKVKESLALQLKVNHLNKALFIEVNPIPVKTALNLMEFGVGNLREPLCDMAPENLSFLKIELKKFNLL